MPVCRLPGAESSACAALIAEYAEKELLPPEEEKPKGRKLLWAKLCSLQPQLEACILAANPSWKADMIPERCARSAAFAPDVAGVPLLAAHSCHRVLRWMPLQQLGSHCPHVGPQ